ncbi:uncharacterized protein LOC126965492, partial [Leptidea sinapis]|uniref:uncharacterized protein LOC126965492 n=1 Tax=Leptidea sinapis TaxID=189913 RepID=UPI0021C38D48
FKRQNYVSSSRKLILCVLLVMTYATCTALVIFLYGYTEAQLLSLTEELYNIWSDGENFYEDNIYNTMNLGNEYKQYLLNTFVKSRLMYVIKLHNENIAAIKLLEKVLSVSMATEFLVLFAGLVAELLGGVKNTFLEIPFTFCQLFINCFLGQKLMDASEQFSKAVYGCGWENFDVSNRKSVLIMLQNSQKTLTLSAGGVATLSFECLMSIVKCSYSFYTTLQSTFNY